MTVSNLFAIEDGRYLEDEDPRAAWIERHLPRCNWKRTIGHAQQNLAEPHSSCTCGHDSLRVLAVPGPVGCIIAEFVDGVGAIRHGLNAHSRGQGTKEEQERAWKVLADVREAWKRLCSSQRRRSLGAGGQNATMQEEASVPPDGLYCLADGELRAVDDVTKIWTATYGSHDRVLTDARAMLFNVDSKDILHLLFTNDRGDEVVVERGML